MNTGAERDLSTGTLTTVLPFHGFSFLDMPCDSQQANSWSMSMERTPRSERIVRTQRTAQRHELVLRQK